MSAPSGDESHLPVYVTELNSNDVLMGRGAPVIDNIGNVRFRQIVQGRRAEYVACNRRQEKDRIARQIVSAVKNRNGRFLRKVESLAEARELGVVEGTSAWTLVNDDAVLQKVKQALRDRTVEDEAANSRPNRRRRGEQVGQLTYRQEAMAQESVANASSLQGPPRLQGAPVATLQAHSQPQQRFAGNQAMLTASNVRQLLFQQNIQHEQQQRNLLASELLRAGGTMGSTLHEALHGVHRSFSAPGMRSTPPESGLPNIASFGITRPASVPGNTSAAMGVNFPIYQPASAALWESQRQQQHGLSFPSTLQHHAAFIQRSGQNLLSHATLQLLAANQHQAVSSGAEEKEQIREAINTTRSKDGPAEIALRQAAERMRQKPPSTGQGEPCLMLSTIEFCILSVFSSIGLPRLHGGESLSETFLLPKTKEGAREAKKRKVYSTLSWSTFANRVVVCCRKLGAEDGILPSLDALSTIDREALISRASSLAEYYAVNLKELARTTVMLLQKLLNLVHANNHGHGHGSMVPTATDTDTGASVLLDNHDVFRERDSASSRVSQSAPDSTLTGSPLQLIIPGAPSLSSFEASSRDVLEAAVGRWACMMSVSEEGIGPAIGYSMSDLLAPQGQAEKQAVMPVATINAESARHVVSQGACVLRLRSVVETQATSEIFEMVKHEDCQSIAWSSRPAWWPPKAEESAQREVWLLESLSKEGLDVILETPTPSSAFPFPRLCDGGLTKAAVLERAVQLTKCLCNQIQTATRARIFAERAQAFSSMIAGMDNATTSTLR